MKGAIMRVVYTVFTYEGVIRVYSYTVFTNVFTVFTYEGIYCIVYTVFSYV